MLGGIVILYFVLGAGLGDNLIIVLGVELGAGLGDGIGTTYDNIFCKLGVIFETAFNYGLLMINKYLCIKMLSLNSLK
jgi:hypothetical protein